MSTNQNNESTEPLAARLEQLNPESDSSLDATIACLKELRDRGLETAHSPNYPSFLREFFPKLKTVLDKIPPQFEHGKKQQVRNAVLDVYHRLPQNEALRPSVRYLLQLATEVLEQDNEENALLCLGIIFDLHKTYKPTQEEQLVAPFFKFVTRVYNKLPATVAAAFDSCSAPGQDSAATATASSSSGPGESAPTIAVPPQPSKPINGGDNIIKTTSSSSSSSSSSSGSKNSTIPSSIESFKVLTECPLIVMLLFQLFRKTVPKFVPDILQLMVNAIKLRPAIAATLMESTANGSAKTRERYSDLLKCQVKTLSFMTYLIRSPPYNTSMKKYESDIAGSVVNMLQHCPPEAISIRKDLLMATRHILASDFREGFNKLVDQFLGESLLLGGSHWMAQGRDSSVAGAQSLVPTKECGMLPLAYSTLADLIHHVRSILNLKQLSKVVYIFTRSLHDPQLPLIVQTTSVKLLLNLVDSIYHNQEPEPNAGRALLSTILEAVVTKLKSLRYYIPEVVSEARRRRNERIKTAASGRDVELIKSYYYTTHAGSGASATGSASPEEKDKEKETSEQRRVVLVHAGDTIKQARASPAESSTAMETDDEPAEKDERAADNSSSVTSSKKESASTKSNVDRQSLRDHLKFGQDPTRGSDGIKEVQTLLNTMILGLKTVLWCVCNYGPKKVEREVKRQIGAQRPQNMQDVQHMPGISGLLNAHEMELVGGLLEWGFQCIAVFRNGVVGDEEYSLSEERRQTAVLTTSVSAVSGGGTSSAPGGGGGALSPKAAAPKAAAANSDLSKETKEGKESQAAGKDATASTGNAGKDAGSKVSQDAKYSAGSEPPSASVKSKVKAPVASKKRTKPTTAEKQRLTKATTAELKIVEHFAEIFTVLDPHNFADLFESKMGLVYANIIRHPTLIAFPKKLLRKNSISHSFLRVLLRFVVQRLPELAGQFSIPPLLLIAQPDLSSIISSPPARINFRNVSIVGPDAAASWEGLGLDKLELQPMKVQESRRRKSEAASKAAPAPPERQSVEEYNLNYHQQLLDGQSKASKNKVAVLSRLVEMVFNCVENYTDEPVAGSGPESVGYTSSGKSSQGQSSQRTGGGLTPGWVIADAMQASLEKLLVLCFVLAPEMTAASQAPLRAFIRNDLVEKFVAREGQTGARLVNRTIPSISASLDPTLRPGSGGGMDLAGSNLGRDCYLMMLRSLLRIVAKRPVLQHMLKAKIDTFMVPMLRSLGALLASAQDGQSRAPARCARKDLVAEVTLLLAVRIPRPELPGYLAIIQNAFEVALAATEHRNTELTRLVLRILENWVDSLSPDVFEALFLANTAAGSQGNSTFAHALSRLLKPSPQPVGTGTLRLLGKLGKRARLALLQAPLETQEGVCTGAPAEPVSAIPKQTLDSALVLELLWESAAQGSSSSSSFSHSSSKKLNICLDQAVRHAKAFIQETFRPRFFREGDLPLLEAADEASLERMTAASAPTAPADVTSSANTGGVASKDSIWKNFSSHLAGGKPTFHLNALEDFEYYKSKATDLLLGCVAQYVDVSEIAELPHLKGAPPKLESCSSAFFSKSRDEIPFLDTPPTAKALGFDARAAGERALLVDMMSALAQGCADANLSIATWPVFRGLAQFFVVAGMEAAVTEEGFDGRKIRTTSKMDTGVDRVESQRSAGSVTAAGGSKVPRVRHRTASVASELPGGGNGNSQLPPPVKAGNGIDPTIINEVIARMLSTACPSHSFVGLRLIEVMINTAAQVLDVSSPAGLTDPQSALAPLLDDLVNRLLVSCHKSSWTDRIGGCCGLRHLMSKMPKEWVSANEPKLVEGFTFVLETHVQCMGVESLFHAASGIQEAILMSYYVPKPKKSKSTNSSSTAAAAGGVSARQAATADGQSSAAAAPMDIDQGNNTASEEKEKNAARARATTSLLIKPLVGRNKRARVLGKRALQLLALCRGISVGELISDNMNEVKKFRSTLLSRSFRSKNNTMQITMMDTLTFLLDQEPCPLNLMSDMNEKRVVQTLADAIVLAEMASNGNSYASCLSFEKKMDSFASANMAAGALYAGPYPFTDIPYMAQVRVSAVGLIRACLNRGGGRLLKVLNPQQSADGSQDMPINRRVRDRAIKLLVTSVLSCWPCVVRSAQDSLATLAYLSKVRISQNPDAFGIPPSQLIQLSDWVSESIKPSTDFTRAMLQGIPALVTKFENKNFGNTVVAKLLEVLAGIMEKHPTQDLLSPNGHKTLDNKLVNMELAGEILAVFSSLPEWCVAPNFKALIQAVLRLTRRPGELLEKLYLERVADFRKGAAFAVPTAAAFYQVQGPLSSPLLNPLLATCIKFPQAALDVLLSPESLANPQSVKLLRDLLGMRAAVELRSKLITEPMTNKLVMAFFKGPPTAKNAANSSTVHQEGGAIDITPVLCGGVDVVLAVVEYDPFWLARRPVVIKKLMEIWRTPGILAKLCEEERLSWQQRRYFSQMCEIYICFFRCISRYIERLAASDLSNPSVKDVLARGAATIYEMLSFAVLRTTSDNSFLVRFYKNEVAKATSLRMRLALIRHYVHLINQERVPMTAHIKEAALRLIVIPLLNASIEDPAFKSCNELEIEPGFKLGEELVREIVQSVASQQPQTPLTVATPSSAALIASASTDSGKSKLLASPSKAASVSGSEKQAGASPASATQKSRDKGRPALAEVTDKLKPIVAPKRFTLENQPGSEYVAPVSVFQNTPASQEALQVQQLQLSTLLIANYGEEMSEYRKELIKFAWNQCKSEASPSKHWAYVNICTFISVFHTPTTMTLQVYVAIVRDTGSDSHDLSRCALDILMPSLAKRLGVRFLQAIRYIKKFIYEEGHKLPLLTNIWQLVARHPEEFYQSRGHFAAHLVSSLNKLWSPHGGASENRALAVNLAQLFLQWEMTRASEESYWKSFTERMASKGEKINVEDLSDWQLSARDASGGYKAPLHLCAAVVHFFMRIALLLSDHKDPESQALHVRCIHLFKVALQVVAKVSRQQRAQQQQHQQQIASTASTDQSAQANTNSSSANGAGTSTLGQAQAKRAAPEQTSPPTNKPSPYPSVIRFQHLSKHLGTIKARQSERAKTARKSALDSSGGADARGGNDDEGAGEREADLGTDEPGLMCCVLEIVLTILSADREAIAMPFIRENESSLFSIIDPVLGCSERGSRILFLNVITELRPLHPLRAEFAAAVAAKKATEERAAQGATPGQQAPGAAPPIGFYMYLLKSVEKRLLVAADDGKSAMTKAAENHGRTVLLQQQQAQKQAQLQSQAVSSSSLSTAKDGAGKPASKKAGAKGKGTSSSADKSGAKSKASIPSKAAHQKRARAFALLQAKLIGAGPVGTLQTLRLVQVLCAKNCAVVGECEELGFDIDVKVGNGQISRQAYDPQIVRRFATPLMKLLSKLIKALTQAAITRGKNATKTAASLGGSPTLLVSAPRSSDSQRGISSRGVCIILELLGPTILGSEVHRKSFISNIQTLIDKLDVHDERVLLTVLALAKFWILSPLSATTIKRKASTAASTAASTVASTASVPSTPATPAVKKAASAVGSLSLTLKERQALMAKLELLERFDGMPQASKLINAYREVVFRVYDPFSAGTKPRLTWSHQLSSRFAAGLLSSDINQRKQFFATFARERLQKGKGPFSKLLALVQQDWSHFGATNWLPVAVQMLLSAINIESDPRCLSCPFGPAIALNTSDVRASAGASSSSAPGEANATMALAAAAAAKAAAAVAQNAVSAVSPSAAAMEVDGDNGAAEAPKETKQRFVLNMRRAAYTKSVNSALAALRERAESRALVDSLQELSVGDRSCAVARAVWLEAFPQAWNALEGHQQMSMNEGLHVLLSRSYHLPKNVLYYSAIQRGAVVIQHTLDEITGLFSKAKTHYLLDDVAWDPYQENAQIFAVRRAATWERMAGWAAPGVIKCVIESILLLRPVPILAAELLRFVGPLFGARAEAIELSELLLQQVKGILPPAGGRVEIMHATGLENSSLSANTTSGSAPGTSGQPGDAAIAGDVSSAQIGPDGTPVRKKKKLDSGAASATAVGNHGTLKKKKTKKLGAGHGAIAALNAAAAKSRHEADTRNAQRWVEALLALYQGGMEDMAHGLIRQWCVSAPTYAGLALESTGSWDRALDAYVAGLTRAEAGKGDYVVARTRPQQTAASASQQFGIPFDNAGGVNNTASSGIDGGGAIDAFDLNDLGDGDFFEDLDADIGVTAGTVSGNPVANAPNNHPNAGPVHGANASAYGTSGTVLAGSVVDSSQQHGGGYYPDPNDPYAQHGQQQPQHAYSAHDYNAQQQGHHHHQGYYNDTYYGQSQHGYYQNDGYQQQSHGYDPNSYYQPQQPYSHVNNPGASNAAGYHDSYHPQQQQQPHQAQQYPGPTLQQHHAHGESSGSPPYPPQGQYQEHGQQQQYPQQKAYPGHQVQQHYPPGNDNGYGAQNQHTHMAHHHSVPMQPPIVWIRKVVSSPEMRVWKDRWQACAKQLGLWDQIGSVATASGDVNELLEAYSRTQGTNCLNMVKSLISRQQNELADRQSLHQQEMPYLAINLYPHLLSVRSSLLNIVCAINESRLAPDLDMVWRQGANAILLEWATTAGDLGSGTRRSLLFSAQRLVELEESINYLANISALASSSATTTANAAAQAYSAAASREGEGGASKSKKSQAAAAAAAVAAVNPIQSQNSQTRMTQINRMMKRWRARVPFSKEDAMDWDDILLSRVLVYQLGKKFFEKQATAKLGPEFASNTVSSSRKNALPSGLINLLHGSVDTWWTVLERARSYRNSGLCDQALNILKSAPSGRSAGRATAEEAFALRREKLLNILKCESSSSMVDKHRHLSAGLQELLGIEINSMASSNKAEVFRLRALYQEELEDPPEAVQEMFTLSVQAYGEQQTAWLDWADYADRLVELKERKQLQQSASPIEWPIRDRQNLGFIMASGILQAVKNGNIKARLHLPKVLWRLHVEAEAHSSSGQQAVVSKSIKHHSDMMPAWIWLPWIPQLVGLLSMSDASAEVGKPLLERLAKEYPNALYYTLRAQFFGGINERRVSRGASTSNTASASNSPRSGAAQKAANAAATGAPPKTAVAAASGAPATSTPSVHPATKGAKPPGASASVPSSPSQENAFLAVRKMLEHFHNRHPKLFQELESMIEEIHNAFKKHHPYEELHSTMQRLLDKCIEYATSPRINGGASLLKARATTPSPKSTAQAATASSPAATATATNEMAQVTSPTQGSAFTLSPTASGEGLTGMTTSTCTLPDGTELEITSNPARIYNVWTMLERMCEKLFSDENVNKRTELHKLLLGRLRDRFEVDFLPDRAQMEVLKKTGSTAGLADLSASEGARQSSKDEAKPPRDMSLNSIIIRIGQWRAMLEDALYLERPAELPMYKWSRELASMAPHALQIPGMHIIKDGLNKPELANHPELRRFSDTVQVDRAEGNAQTLRLGFEAQNGRTTYFVVKSNTQLANTRSDQRSVQLKRLLNAMLDGSNSTSRKRHLRFPLPVVVPVHLRLCLQLTEKDLVSLSGVYKQEMARRGVASPKLDLCTHMLEQQEQAIKASPDLTGARRKGFEAACKIVPDHLLINFVRGHAGSSAGLHASREIFTKHLALSSLLSTLFCSGDRVPAKTSFDPTKGQLLDYEVRPRFKTASKGDLEASASVVLVPFRLTRNISYLLTPAGIDGTLSDAMLAAAGCFSLKSNKNALKAFLELYMVHELVDHNTNASTTHAQQRALFRNRVLHQILKRNIDVMMGRLKTLAPDSAQDLADVVQATPTSTAEQLANEVLVQDSTLAPEEPKPQDPGLVALIRQASDPARLSWMDSNFIPWF